MLAEKGSVLAELVPGQKKGSIGTPVLQWWWGGTSRHQMETPLPLFFNPPLCLPIIFLNVLHFPLFLPTNEITVVSEPQRKIGAQSFLQKWKYPPWKPRECHLQQHEANSQECKWAWHVVRCRSCCSVQFTVLLYCITEFCLQTYNFYIQF